MNTVAVTSPFVPLEWVKAHGLKPILCVPASPEGNLLGRAAGLCPFARGQLAMLFGDNDFTGIVLASTCDQLRRAAEFRPREDVAVFTMHVPSTWGTSTVLQYYIDELTRLGRFLEQLGGVTPRDDDLADVMRHHDTDRAMLRGLRGSLPPRRYAEAIHAYQRSEALPEATLEPSTSSGPALALAGGPLTQRDFRIFDFVEEAGGHVALNATELGELALPAPLDRRTLPKNPLVELATNYFGTIPGVFRRPNSELYKWLERHLRDRGIVGVIYIRYLWCDLWHAELERLREWLSIPVVDLQIDGTDDTAEHLKNRIDAFVEILS